ncbi:hypothetical protein CC80DRAFT_53851 [Byssothecium circinans]|uniref:Uncharacterized protein n=1 Tax=Byssothecium circinans TaxID=147558 RepID=A0A6A5TXJ4_9PLEO|nr:hypothetical protein CC80DRAFT_53851 [Byssothecium circinans]
MWSFFYWVFFPFPSHHISSRLGSSRLGVDSAGAGVGVGAWGRALDSIRKASERRNAPSLPALSPGLQCTTFLSLFLSVISLPIYLN